MNFCRNIASQSSTMTKPVAFIRQTLLQEAEGVNLKLNPIIFTSSSFRNHYGSNCYGSDQTSWSWVIAHMLTIAVVPTILKWFSIYLLCMENLAHEKKKGLVSASLGFPSLWHTHKKCWKGHHHSHYTQCQPQILFKIEPLLRYLDAEPS